MDVVVHVIRIHPQTSHIISHDAVTIIMLINKVEIVNFGLEKFWDVEDDRSQKSWHQVGHHSSS